MRLLFETFENGNVSGPEGQQAISSISWNEHQSFKGVFLKHLIKGNETGGLLSCHLVKVNPGCTIDSHVHTGKLEVHEVIGGSGSCIIGGKVVAYQPGSVALIPADVNHRVEAGDDGIYILAKFSPALL